MLVFLFRPFSYCVLPRPLLSISRTITVSNSFKFSHSLDGVLVLYMVSACAMLVLASIDWSGFQFADI